MNITQQCLLVAALHPLQLPHYANLSYQSIFQSTTLETIIPPQVQYRQCRICLDTQSSELNPLLNLCDCSGSLKYLHKDCYHRWLQKLILEKPEEQVVKMQQEGLECQICKGNIQIALRNRYQCQGRERVCRKICKVKFMFAFTVAIFTISLASIIFLAYFFLQRQLNFGEHIYLGTTILTSISLLAVAEIVLVYFFLKTFFISKTRQIISFVKGTIKRGNPNRIAPIYQQNT